MVAAFFLALLAMLLAMRLAYLLQGQHGHGARDGIGVLACAETGMRRSRLDFDFVQAFIQFFSEHPHILCRDIFLVIFAVQHLRRFRLQVLRYGLLSVIVQAAHTHELGLSRFCQPAKISGDPGIQAGIKVLVAKAAFAHGLLPQLPFHAIDHGLAQTVRFAKAVLAVLPVGRAAAAGHQPPRAAQRQAVLGPEKDALKVLPNAQRRHPRLIGHGISPQGFQAIYLFAIFDDRLIGTPSRSLPTGKLYQNRIIPVAQEPMTGADIGEIGVKIAGLMYLHRPTEFQLLRNTVFGLIIKLLAGIDCISVHIPQKRCKHLLPSFVLPDKVLEPLFGSSISFQADLIRSPQPPVDVLAAKYPLCFSAAHIQVQGFPVLIRRCNILIKILDSLLVSEVVVIAFRRIHQLQQAREQKGRHIAHPVPNAAADKIQNVQHQADGGTHKQDKPNPTDPVSQFAPNGVLTVAPPIGQRHTQGMETLGLVLQKAHPCSSSICAAATLVSSRSLNRGTASSARSRSCFSYRISIRLPAPWSSTRLCRVAASH